MSIILRIISHFPFLLSPFLFIDSLVDTYAYLRNETINESLLMNKIVGRVADRSACNRKENRIKRALNGAIIHGNGDEGARRKAQSGLRGVVMTVPWSTEDVSGHSFRGRLTRARNYDGPFLGSLFPRSSSVSLNSAWRFVVLPRA